MDKRLKNFLLIIMIGMIFVVSSCTLEENEEDANNDVDENKEQCIPDGHLDIKNCIYEKEFYTISIEELQQKISSENSLYSDTLEFYYNKAFLDKYNFTTNPDVNTEYFDPHDYTEYIQFYPHYAVPRFNYPEIKLSTPKELLDTIYKDQFNYGASFIEDSNNAVPMRPYYFAPMRFRYINDSPNEVHPNTFNYGVTYKARTIFPQYLSFYDIDESRNKRIETEKVDICPNHLIPSLEEYDAMYNGKYQMPVVMLENFEYIFLFGRLYIDGYPIECMIFIQCSYNVDSFEELKYGFDKLNVIEQIKNCDENGCNLDFETYSDYSIFNTSSYCSQHDLNVGWLDENNEECWFFQSIYFTKLTVYSDEYDFNLHDYDEIYKEYFNTFLEGISEIKIDYVNHD